MAPPEEVEPEVSLDRQKIARAVNHRIRAFAVVRWRTVALIGGYISLGLAGSLAPSIAVAVLGRDAGLLPLLAAMGLAVVAGAAPVVPIRRQGGELSRREAILLTTLLWVVAGILGALPFYFSPFFKGFVDALFESVSGFTTTGAWIQPYVGPLCPSLRFTRARLAAPASAEGLPPGGFKRLRGRKSASGKLTGFPWPDPPG